MKKFVMHLLPLLFLASTLGCTSDDDRQKPIVIEIEDLDSGQSDATTPDMSTVTPQPDMSMTPDMTTPDAAPDLPIEPVGTACQTKDAPIQLAKTCTFDWSTCEDGVTYSFRCNIKNLAGNIFSLCNCYENGVKDEADKIVDVCNAEDWAAVEAIVNEQCGWDLR